MGFLSRRASIGALLVGLAWAMSASSAFAQDAATAEALFRKGLDDMEAGQYARGCPALGESYRLDPRPGTLFTLAECEAKGGLLASAVAHYGDYLALFARMPGEQRARQQGRDVIAQRQIADLEALVPHLIVVVPADAPAGTIVRRDGVMLGTPSWGIALPVNPGDHELATKAPRGDLTVTRVSIARGETKRVEVLVAQPPPAPSEETVPARRTPANPPAVVPMNAPASDSTRDTGAVGSRRVWTYILGGLAIEGFAVGTAAGILAWDKKRVIDRECDGSECSPVGLDAADTARSLGTLSTVSFGVGAASLVGAWVLWATEPATPSAANTHLQPVVAADGRSGGFVGVRGGF
jgi:hypothetical protein